MVTRLHCYSCDHPFFPVHINGYELAPRQAAKAKPFPGNAFVIYLTCFNQAVAERATEARSCHANGKLRGFRLSTCSNSKIASIGMHLCHLAVVAHTCAIRATAIGFTAGHSFFLFYTRSLRNNPLLILIWFRIIFVGPFPIYLNAEACIADSFY